MSYMEKKTSKRQAAIITLSDHNQKQIEDLQKEQQLVIADFKVKQEGKNTADIMFIGNCEFTGNSHILKNWLQSPFVKLQ